MKTIKEYRESTPLSQQKEFAEKLQVWLGEYTQEVFNRVMKNHIEEIINNEFALKLIDELYERTLKERADEIRHIEYVLGYEGKDLDGFHNHPLEHSEAYRDVLYDMFIRNRD